MRWGTRARAHADAPQSLCSSAEKQIMRRDGLISHLCVIAEGYARRTAIQHVHITAKSNPIRPACTLSYCMGEPHEGSPRCTGLRTVYLCSTKRTVKVLGLHIHAHVRGRSTCKCSDCP